MLAARKSEGLLRRASAFKAHDFPVASPGLSGDLGQDRDEEGITPSERSEISARIEQLSARPGVALNLETLRLKPKKKSFIFPLAVNLIVIAITTLGIFGLSVLFSQRMAEAHSGSALSSTTEGLLIQQLKRDSDSKLQEKEKAISEIQGKLQDVDRQKNELSASIDQQVAARESSLRASLNDAIEKEHARLSQLGESESAIQAKMKAFEAEKARETDSQIQAMRVKADADKKAQDAKLDQVVKEFQGNISSLNQDRNRILEESQSREAQLRASLDAKNAELAGQSAAAKAELSKAQNQLAQLADENAKSAAAEDRVIGLYASIEASLRDHRYNDAQTSISALEAYLADPSIAAMPSIKARRNADLFVTAALQELVQTEARSSSADAAKLVDLAASLTAAQEAAAAGRKAMQAGDRATAEARYQECLSKIPAILEAHDYFLNKLKSEEEARRSRLATAIDAADRAWQRGDYDESLSRYVEALTILDLAPALRDTMLARIAQHGQETSDRDRAAKDSSLAKLPYDAAMKKLALGDWNGSISDFLALVSAYPYAREIPDAFKGIEAARAGLDKDMQSRNAAYENSVASLRGKSLDDAAASQGQIASLKKQLDEAQAATAAAVAKLNELQASPAPAQTSAAAGADSALSRSYAAFLKDEESISSGTGDLGFLEKQKRLMDFLREDDYKKLFPGMDRIVEEELSSYQEALSSEDLRIAADIAIQVLGAKGQEERNSIIDSESRHYSGDKTVRDFIAALRDRLH